MELTLSLGEPPARPLEDIAGSCGDALSMDMKLGFCMGLEFELERKTKVDEENRGGDKELEKEEERRWSVDPPVQLNLLPLAPVPRLDSTQLALPRSTKDIGNLEAVSVEEAEGRAAIRTISSFHMNLAMSERASTRGSDEEENVRGRKKLRLSKEQSAFLEESFKEQSTLNPKHKFVLARQLNLRPRQIEVWFQNRRARTKLKQMEMDCEYLKRRSDALREENRRLHKEITELRVVLKTSQPFRIQIPPPTTLSICPSCERLCPLTSPPQPPAFTSPPFPEARFSETAT